MLLVAGYARPPIAALCPPASMATGYAPGLMGRMYSGSAKKLALACSWGHLECLKRWSLNKYIPNSFQVPNALVDELMADMSGPALKCYLQVVRQTIGWNKEVDYIPASQFHHLTGIKKADTLSQAIKELEELGLIIAIRQKGKVTGYRVNMETTTPENGVHPKKGYTRKSGTPESKAGQGENHPHQRGIPENQVHSENGDTLDGVQDANCTEPPPVNGYTQKTGTPVQRGVVPPQNGGGSTPSKRGTSKPNTKPTNTKPNIYIPPEENLGELPEYTPPVPNGRFRTWEQLGYKTLPDRWRVMALEKYPELNEQSLQNLWNGHEANCLTKPGLSQLIRKWEAGWMFTLSSFATGQIQRQQPRQAKADQQYHDYQQRQTDTTGTTPANRPKSGLAGIEVVEFEALQKLKPDVTEQQVIDFAHSKGIDNFAAIQYLKKQESLSI